MKLEKSNVSYMLGQSIGGDFRRKGFDIDVSIFTDSFAAAYAGEESKMRASEMQQIMMAFQNAMQEKKQHQQNEAVFNNLKKGQAFLEENRKNQDIHVTDSGLQYRVIKEGAGKKPKLSDTVVTHYEGKTISGKIFDSSVRRGAPSSFPVNGVIRGWQEALQLMREGSKWEIFVPSDLAYGQTGSGGTIEPHSTLIFEVELIAVK
jgi:FKBP-type peptidyl-prolyl cis-trans isomerase FklB